MVKNEFGTGTLLHQRELGNRVDPRIPGGHAPGLDDSLVGHKFDMPSNDMAAEECERATCLTADLRGRSSRGHAGLHGCTELRHIVELFRVGECIIDTFAAGFENWLLVNGFPRTSNLLFISCPSRR